MSLFSILSTANPMTRFGPVQPMSREDRIFWAERDRVAREVRERRAAREGRA